MTHEGMLAETVRLTGHAGDVIGAYFARPLGPGPYPVSRVMEMSHPSSRH